jgi:glycosyltransferase involved in cell wall biosynthesis
MQTGNILTREGGMAGEISGLRAGAGGRTKKILEIGNWAPPVCSWTMSLEGLRRELDARDWDCQVMNLNENRRIKSADYIDVQNGWDYLRKVVRAVRQGYAVHTRVNAESTDLYILAFVAMFLARVWRRPAFLTYGGGHKQTYFPAPRFSLRHLAFSVLFRLPNRIYCNSEEVKRVILTTGIPSERVLAIPHTSAYYVEFERTRMPEGVEKFFSEHEGIIFSYVCFRKEFVLEFLAEAIRRFRVEFPKIGFLWLGPWECEMPQMRELLEAEGIRDAVYSMGSVPHGMFLNILSHSLAYIRTPMTDGVCSSVLEALKLKVPVLGSDNGTRPAGTELWQDGDVESLLEPMREVVQNHQQVVNRIPEIVLEDNAKRFADDIEGICSKRNASAPASATT